MAATKKAAPPKKAAPSTQAVLPVSIPDSGSAAEALACSTFSDSLLSTINDAVSTSDLAPLIRISMGEPADGGDVSADAPWFTFNAAAENAASDDSSYQSLSDDAQSLQTDITQADPSGDLSIIGVDADTITADCELSSLGGDDGDSGTTPDLPPVPAGDGTYTNVDGNQIPDPVSAPAAPAGATAQCSDGTYSFSQHHSGTCSHHGGVAEWL